ncbi:MAG: hypothetical protein JW976_07390 [Syntrophaceae bacterium]|nr:hypothetical protein [Syntrophaceae bacterium]
MGLIEFEHFVVSAIVLFLLIIVLVLQIQVRRNTKDIEKGEIEIRKIVEEVLKKLIKQKM